MENCGSTRSPKSEPVISPKVQSQRSYFFEFAGMPKSGKTTTLDIVSHYLRRKGHRVREFHGGGRHVDIDKSSPAALLWLTALRTIDFILLSAERNIGSSRVYLIDRGLFDKCIFASVLKRRNDLDADESELLTRMLTARRFAGLFDCVFLFVTSPQLAIQREQANKLVQSEGRIMNEQYLTMLRESSLLEAKQCNQSFRRIELIDTAGLDGSITNTAQSIAGIIEQIVQSE